MTRIIPLVVLPLFFVLLGGCGEAENTVPMTEKVTLQAVVGEAEGGGFVVQGLTNLPAGTEIGVTVSDEISGFSAQAKTAVISGVFRTEPFAKDNNFPAGNYTADLNVPLAKFQPESVQKVIGAQGEHLTGPLVETSKWGGKIVATSFKFAMGTPEQVELAKQQHENTVADIADTLESLLDEGRAMDRQDYRSCGVLMREFQPIAKAIRQKAEPLTNKHFMLKVATIDVHECVSCAGSALDACTRVEEALAEQ